MSEDILTPRLVLRLMPEAFQRASLDGDSAAAENQIGLRVPADWYGETGLILLVDETR